LTSPPVAGWTFTWTSALALAPELSVTVSLKPSAVPTSTSGAINVGRTVSAATSVIAGPPVCAQA
jgi:hypothetical protein